VIRRLRPRLPEQLLDEAVPRNDLVRAQQKKSEQCSLPRAADPQRSVVDADLERAENAEFDPVAAHRLSRSVLQKSRSAKS
jgi:hypothetical protein